MTGAAEVVVTGSSAGGAAASVDYLGIAFGSLVKNVTVLAGEKLLIFVAFLGASIENHDLRIVVDGSPVGHSAINYTDHPYSVGEDVGNPGDQVPQQVTTNWWALTDVLSAGVHEVGFTVDGDSGPGGGWLAQVVVFHFDGAKVGPVQTFL